MFLQKRTRWKWAYPNRYKRAFAFSILPYLHGIVFVLRRTYLLQRRSWTGLPRSVQITRWVRRCLYTGRTASMCLQITCLHLVFLPFGQCVSTTFTFSRMTVRPRQFTSVHHTTQADTFRNVVIRRGIFSRQLHTSMLPLTHVPVGYPWWNMRLNHSKKKRTFNSYLDSLVSHF